MKRLLLLALLCATVSSAQTITTSTLNSATVGSWYEDTVETSGGTAPRRVFLRGSTFPYGLWMNPLTGIIKGTPRQVESKQIVFMVQDSTYAWSKDTLTLAVMAAPTSPDVPTLNVPADGRLGVGIDTLLAWNDVTGETKYHIQLDTVNTFTGTLKLNDSTLAANTTSDSTKTLTNSETYYWRVRAGNEAGWSNWSSTRSFTTVASSGSSFAYVGSKLDSTTSASALDTISYTVGTGSGRYLVMSSYWRENADLYDSQLDSVVWVVSSTRQNFSWVDSVSANNGNWSNRRMETWVLASPTSGSGNMIYYLNSGRTAGTFQTTITEFEGANTALRDTNHNRANYSSPATLALTTENGDIVVGFFAQFETNTTMTEGSGETRRQGNYIRNILVTEPATTTSTTLSITLGSADVWIFSGVSLRPN